MDRYDLNRMFDGLAPDPQREQELLEELLQDDTRRKRPMKKWKRVVLAVAAAALLVTGAAAAVVPGISQRLLEYLGVTPEDAQTVKLLAPGAMEVDVTAEDNGVVLHATQILRDRNAIRILADLTAPEGTSLYMGEPDPPGVSTIKGFYGGGEMEAGFLDAAGMWLGGAGDGLVPRYGWELIGDDDPRDNQVTLICTLLCSEEGAEVLQKAAFLQVPAANLVYYDRNSQEIVEVCPGDWSFRVPLSENGISWVLKADQVIGELDGAVIRVEEVHLSPMSLDLIMKREGGMTFTGMSTTNEIDAAYGRWLSIGNYRQVTLTTKDGEVIPLEMFGGGETDEERKSEHHRLSQITDPAKFQGGTLTIEWDFTRNSEESGSYTISLDNLKPVELALSTH